MNASIYTMGNGTELVYQLGNSRVVTGKNGKVLRAEVKEKGQWRPARNYLNPNLENKVKAALR